MFIICIKKEGITVGMRGFDCPLRGNYFWGEPLNRTELEGSVKKLEKVKNRVTGEMKKCVRGSGNCVIDLFVGGLSRVVRSMRYHISAEWKLCNITS